MVQDAYKVPKLVIKGGILFPFYLESKITKKPHPLFTKVKTPQLFEDRDG